MLNFKLFHVLLLSFYTDEIRNGWWKKKKNDMCSFIYIYIYIIFLPISCYVESSYFFCFTFNFELLKYHYCFMIFAAPSRASQLKDAWKTLKPVEHMRIRLVYVAWKVITVSEYMPLFSSIFVQMCKFFLLKVDR